MTSNAVDRLYNLLPVVHRLRDADKGYPLRALLQVISEQVNVVQADIAQLYENWFIETCQDWVVPYIGDLVGYAPPASTGEPVDVRNARALSRERMVISRSEVANTVRFRRRKGTLAVLAELSQAVADWPGHAAEFYSLLSYTQNINLLHLSRGRTIDVRNGHDLEELGGPFEETAHTVDVRATSSLRSPERYNIPAVGLFIWRLKTYSVTHAPAFCLDKSPSFFQFNCLGHDTPLYNRPHASVGHQPGKLNLPTTITRRDLCSRKSQTAGKPSMSGVPLYYGDKKSFAIFTGPDLTLVDPKTIIAADLSDWKYRPLPGQVAVDPELGRIAFPAPQPRRQGVWVSYTYAFSADIGGGEYSRPLSQPATHTLYQVGKDETFTHINDALKQWQSDGPANAAIEITDSAVYSEPIDINLKAGQTLQIRAANQKRPVIKLLDWQSSQPDNLSITGEASANGRASCWFTLDGIMVAGRGIQVQGSIAGLEIRHCTLVPGWGLDCDCEPLYPGEPSLELDNAPDCVRIERSIIGSIQVERDESREDPCNIYLSDSILDATNPQGIAVGAPGKLCAYAVLDVRRCTVIGQVQTHAIRLAENSVFMGQILACRRQLGCMRFCYIADGSRTPKRYECLPDLVVSAASAKAQKDGITGTAKDALLASETLRVEPDFNSLRYGSPTYCQLSDSCATEISRGADDESEMGAFHDLYQPQRAESLSVRLNEYTPAGMNAGIIFAS
jgi:hypothetical protein